MIGNTKLIFILNNEGKGASLNFPETFPYPATKTVVNPRTQEETVYYKTDKIKNIAGQPALIYTVNGFRLNLDDFADGDFVGESTPDSSVEKSAGLRLKEARDVLFDQLEHYKTLDKKDRAAMADSIYERFTYMSKEDYLKLVEALA